MGDLTMVLNQRKRKPRKKNKILQIKLSHQMMILSLYVKNFKNLIKFVIFQNAKNLSQHWELLVNSVVLDSVSITPCRRFMVVVRRQGRLQDNKYHEREGWCLGLEHI